MGTLGPGHTTVKRSTLFSSHAASSLSQIPAYPHPDDGEMMGFWDNFWNVFWLFFWFFALFAYLIVLFQVVTDLFRDAVLPGWSKALWVVCFFFLPFLTVLAYLLVRGPGMAIRQTIRAESAQEAAENYFRGLVGTGSAEEIAKAKSLLDSGAITEQEFTVLKNRALAGPGQTMGSHSTTPV